MAAGPSRWARTASSGARTRRARLRRRRAAPAAARPSLARWTGWTASVRGSAVLHSTACAVRCGGRRVWCPSSLGDTRAGVTTRGGSAGAVGPHRRAPQRRAGLLTPVAPTVGSCASSRAGGKAGCGGRQGGSWSTSRWRRPGAPATWAARRIAQVRGRPTRQGPHQQGKASCQAASLCRTV